jgi:hypothetical protein
MPQIGRPRVLGTPELLPPIHHLGLKESGTMLLMHDQESGSASGVHPRLLRDREWINSTGERWHMRGHELEPKQARRLLKRPGVRVLHVDSPEPHEPRGPELQSLLTRLEGFWAGEAAPMNDFVVGDFRNSAHELMLVIQESC